MNSNQIVWTSISSSSNSTGYYDRDGYFTPYQPTWYSTTTPAKKKEEIPDGPLDWLDRRVEEITDLVAV